MAKDSPMYLVEERLNLFDKLFALRKHFQGRKNERKTIKDDNGLQIVDHAYRYFSGLLSYLLITCFDILAEQDEWKDFGTWLKSNKYKDQLEQYKLAILEAQLDPIASSKFLYERYLEQFGMSKGIKKFISEELSDAERNQLLNSIKIGVWTKQIPSEHTEIKDLNKKINYFIAARNLFTHQGYPYTGSDDSGRKWAETFRLSEGKIYRTISNYIIIEDKATKYTYIQFIGWPLKIREVLSDYLKRKFEVSTHIPRKHLCHFSGDYCFEVLWSEVEKILWGKTDDGKVIYLGGGRFEKNEAFEFIKSIVDDAIKEDNAMRESKKTGIPVTVRYSKYSVTKPQ